MGADYYSGPRFVRLSPFCRLPADDGDRLRVKKTENSTTTYYLRSSVLGGQVVAEMNGSGQFSRGYVYLGGQMVAIQKDNAVSWVHQDPVTKSQRVTNGSGTVVSTIDLDPWGGETATSSNQAFQPHRFTTYERDANGGDDAMMRRYAGSWMRFSQPDPYGGSYDLTDPQSFNRYSYVRNDPVNFVDPSGLDKDPPRLHPYDPTRPYDPNLEPPIHGSGGERGSFGGVSFGPIEIELPPTQGGPEGPGGPTQPKPKKKLDPANPVCQALAKKIDNILKEVRKRAQELLDDELKLPLKGPGPLKDTI